MKPNHIGMKHLDSGRLVLKSYRLLQDSTLKTNVYVALTLTLTRLLYSLGFNGYNDTQALEAQHVNQYRKRCLQDEHHLIHLKAEFHSIMAEQNLRSIQPFEPKDLISTTSTASNELQQVEQNAPSRPSSSDLLVQILRDLEVDSQQEAKLKAAVQCLKNMQTYQVNIRGQLERLQHQLKVETRDVAQLKRKKAKEADRVEEDVISKAEKRVFAETKGKIIELQHELRSKSEEFAKVNAELQRRGEDVEQLQELEQEQRLLIAKLKLEHDKIKHEKQRDLRSLTNELRQEQLKVETATAALNSLHQQHKFATEQAASAQSEIEGLMKEVFQLRRTSEDSKRLLTEKTKELARNENEIGVLRNDLQASQVEVSELHDQLSQAKTREREQSSRILQLTNRVQTLEKRLVENMQTHEEEMACAATALEKNEKLRNVLKRDLQTSKSKLDLKEQLYTQVKSEYEQQLSELHGRLATTTIEKQAKQQPILRTSPKNLKRDKSREESMTPRSKATYLRQQIASCKIPSSLPELQ